MAKPMGLAIDAVEIGDVDDLEDSFSAIVAGRPDAIWFASLVLASAAAVPRTVQLTVRHRLPAFYMNPRAVDIGGLFSYAENTVMLWRRIARYVGKILQGAKPADLPIEQPMEMHLKINLKTAKALGLTIPPSLLLRADQVIE